MNQKGRRIKHVIIQGKKLTAYDESGIVYKLTRSQRDLFVKYYASNMDPSIEASITKEFSNPKILSDDFLIEKVD